MLDLILRAAPDARVFTLDTHVLFPETYATWKAVEARYGIEVEVFQGPSLGRQAAEHGDRLWEREPDACCDLRKVRPLDPRAGRRRRLGRRPAPRPVAVTRRHARSSRGTPSTRAGSSTRSPTGPTRTSGATSPSTTCPTTPCTTRATRRSAAPTARCPARDARAAGPAAARPSAACTPERAGPAQGRRSGPRDHAPVEQPPDLALAEPEHARRGSPRCARRARGARRAASRAGGGRSSSGEAGHEVGADPRLLDASRTSGWPRTRAGPPPPAGGRSGRAPTRRRCPRTPRGSRPACAPRTTGAGPRRSGRARRSARSRRTRSWPVTLSRLRNASAVPGDLAQRRPLAAGERHDHHAAAVAGAEVVPERAVEVVAVARPRPGRRAAPRRSGRGCRPSRRRRRRARAGSAAPRPCACGGARRRGSRWRRARPSPRPTPAAPSSAGPPGRADRSPTGSRWPG